MRIPPWVDRGSLAIAAKGAAPRLQGHYAVFAEPHVGKPIAPDFDLTESTHVLQHATRQILTHLRGDEVAAMDNFGMDLAFFPKSFG